MNQKELDISFMREAFKSARDLSQDANTQTGGILVDQNNNIISRGASRIHFGLPERYEGRPGEERILLKRPEKYDDLIHSERDTIYGANRKGISLQGCTLYSTWALCDDCAKTTINNGIKRVVGHQSTTNWYNEARKNIQGRQDWEEGINKAINLLKKGKVKYELMTEHLGDVSILFDDKIRSP